MGGCLGTCGCGAGLSGPKSSRTHLELVLHLDLEAQENLLDKAALVALLALLCVRGGREGRRGAEAASVGRQLGAARPVERWPAARAAAPS